VDQRNWPWLEHQVLLVVVKGLDAGIQARLDNLKKDKE
jgi:hypothetical protein